MRKFISSVLLSLLAAATVAAPAGRRQERSVGNSNSHTALRANDGRAADADAKVTAATFGPKRTKPVFTGEFQVDLVVVAFPDCYAPESVSEVQESLNRARGATLKEYFEEYSQGVTWPVLAVCPAVYQAPHPYGYYCRHDNFANLIGFQGDAEGRARAKKLRDDALAFAQKSSKGMKKGQVTCYVYCNRVDKSKLEEVLRPLYPPKPTSPDALDKLTLYKPPLPWADPLWPNSIVQVTYPADGGTLIHELGHVLGAPDFYHASEEHDGVEGSPSLPWAYGPTGPAYCRYIYQAFVPKDTYPTYTKDGEYTLDARASRIEASGPETPKPVLGCFIPSSHPNYVFQLEYVYGERPPVGIEGAQGLLVNVINVTMASPMLGPPDLCYTYRRGDPFMKGEEGDDVYLRAGDSFTMKSDPAARIPPLLPGGIEITDIREADGKCTFKLAFTKEKPTAKALKDALLPRIRIVEVSEVLPTSMRASCEMMYRGEPLVDEYGFVWDVAKNPTVKKNRYPLYHRDRWDARILGLKPGTKYYVRAYAKNANGITYSKRELEVTTPKAVNEVPPLLTDRILDNFYVERWYFTTDGDGYFNSGNTVLTLMSLGVYYGVVPGTVAKPGAKTADGIDVRSVHTNPGTSRPKFRLAAFESYFAAMKKLAAASGLRDRGFDGKVEEWGRKCARELKIAPKDQKTAFVRIRDASALEAQAGTIKKWLDLSQPVLLVRENTFMPGVTERTYPLDIAIIDGYDADGAWHVVFPEGGDRGSKSVTSGYWRADTLMVSVVDAVLMFYHP